VENQTSPLRVALLQMASEGGAIEEKAVKGEEYCRRAARQGADVALLPEMWSIGYAKYPHGEERARADWLKLAVPRDGSFVQRFRRLARELRMAIAVTYLEARPELRLSNPDWPGRWRYLHLCEGPYLRLGLSGGIAYSRRRILCR
jgi:predicted amidohydrolase